MKSYTFPKLVLFSALIYSANRNGPGCAEVTGPIRVWI